MRRARPEPSRAIATTAFARAALAAIALVLAGAAIADEGEATWALIKPDLFGARPMEDAKALVTLEAPARAEDAALVPIEVRVAMPPGDSRAVKTLTLVVDENPSPLVARFKLGDGRKPFALSTRIRVNSYSFVRAVVETDDGALHMTKAFVKAAGGCSAPAIKDPAEAKAHLGRMRFRVLPDRNGSEAQLQLRHPNNSGMQMDPVSRLYAAAWFVQSLSVKQGDQLLFAMEGGISLSEDPTFRFSYRSDGSKVAVEAQDTSGNHFRESFEAGGSS